MDQPSTLEALLKMFTFNKKKDLERYCRTLVVSGSDFAGLILSCEHQGEPFIHQITYRDIVSRLLRLKHETLTSLPSHFARQRMSFALLHL